MAVSLLCTARWALVVRVSERDSRRAEATSFAARAVAVLEQCVGAARWKASPKMSPRSSMTTRGLDANRDGVQPRY